MKSEFSIIFIILNILLLDGGLWGRVFVESLLNIVFVCLVGNKSKMKFTHLRFLNLAQLLHSFFVQHSPTSKERNKLSPFVYLRRAFSRFCKLNEAM